MKVLVVAAHPDDEILGCGGTIERLKKEGHEVDYRILGQGRGDALDNQFDKVSLLIWVQTIECDIKRIKPDIIFTHYEKDLNIDHQITYQAVITAARPQPRCCVKEIYSFEVLSSTEWICSTSFTPNIFYKLTEKAIEEKWSVFRNVYGIEVRAWPHPRSMKGIWTLAKFRGMQCGCEYAEAFKTVRRII